MNVTPSQFELLSRMLEVSDLRHRVISQNVANVNTPGYRHLSVSFEQALARQAGRSGRLDAQAVEARVEETPGLAERADGNNVDIDREMGMLSKNALLYQTYAQVLGTQLSMMKSAITGR